MHMERKILIRWLFPLREPVFCRNRQTYLADGGRSWSSQGEMSLRDCQSGLAWIYHASALARPEEGRAREALMPLL
jgi:hypothetical protein